MNFYKRISKQEIIIPDSFDMRFCQLVDLNKNTPSKFDMAVLAFKFGYMQGIRAERAGKAVKV